MSTALRLYSVDLSSSFTCLPSEPHCVLSAMLGAVTIPEEDKVSTTDAVRQLQMFVHAMKEVKQGWETGAVGGPRGRPLREGLVERALRMKVSGCEEREEESSPREAQALRARGAKGVGNRKTPVWLELGSVCGGLSSDSLLNVSVEDDSCHPCRARWALCRLSSTCSGSRAWPRPSADGGEWETPVKPGETWCGSQLGNPVLRRMTFESRLVWIGERWSWMERVRKGDWGLLQAAGCFMAVCFCTRGFRVCSAPCALSMCLLSEGGAFIFLIHTLNDC